MAAVYEAHTVHSDWARGSRTLLQVLGSHGLMLIAHWVWEAARPQAEGLTQDCIATQTCSAVDGTLATQSWIILCFWDGLPSRLPGLYPLHVGSNPQLRQPKMSKGTASIDPVVGLRAEDRGRIQTHACAGSG